MPHWSAIPEASGEIREVQARLSRTQVEFLDFVARHPRGLQPESFAPLARLDEFMRYPMQPWPIFLADSRIRQIDSVNRRLYDLIRSIPERVFGNDPQLLAEAFGVDRSEAERAIAAIRATHGARGMLARGDFIDTPAGFRCLEFNVVSNLGGWGNAIWADRYRQVPFIRSFLEESGARISCTDSMRTFFFHAVGEARRHSLSEDELNLAFLIGADDPPTPAWQEYSRRLYAETREAGGGLAGGDLLVCDGADLRRDGRGLWLGDRRVHVVVELSMGVIAEPIFAAQLAGTAHVYNGPASRILTDKVNLAILSQLAEAGLVSPEEKELIQTFVPWTRQVSSVFTDRCGERAFLPDLLLAERDRLVLKLGFSKQGHDVWVGAFVPPEQWEAIVERALGEGTWVVQERQDFLPYLFQKPGGGCIAHDLVWGFFTFGEHFGGGFLRMTPRGEVAVINAARGATESIFFEVADG